MSTRARKERKRTEIPFRKEQKTGTPPLLRSTTWRERSTRDRGREVRPTRQAVAQGVLQDLGWEKPSKYLTTKGGLTKAAKPKEEK